MTYLKQKKIFLFGLLGLCAIVFLFAVPKNATAQVGTLGLDLVQEAVEAAPVAGALAKGVIAATILPTQSELVNQLQVIVYDIIIWPFAQAMNASVVILIGVGRYNDFAKESIVTLGWTTVRDFANMFFVLIMLIIAIGTIVKWEVINYRQQLRRLIIMALLINFSKTIVLFMIDISQVIMLTFLQAVQNAIQGGVIRLLGIDQVVATANVGTSFVTFFIAAVMVVIATIVILALSIVLFARVIALWMVIIFAPFAFIASVLPQTREYYDKWWKILGSQLAAGPAIAFMLWLIFTLVGGSQSTTVANGLIEAVTRIPIFGGLLGGIDLNVFVKYIVGIGLLMYTLRLASTMGAAGATAAAGVGGFAIGRLTSGSKAAARYVTFGKSGQGGVYGRAKSGALNVIGGAAEKRVKLADSKLSRLDPSSFADAAERRKIIASPLTRLARRVDRASTVAKSRQSETRVKAERDYISRLRSDQVESMLDAQSVSKGGFRTATAPQQKVLLEELASRVTAKDAAGDPVVSKKQAKEWRDNYAKLATEKELQEYDVKTAGRGLDENNYTDMQRLEDILPDLARAGKLNADIVSANMNTATEVAAANSTEKQLIDIHHDLPPEDRDAFVEGIRRAFERAMRQRTNVESRFGRDSAQYRAANGQVGKLRNTLVRTNPQATLQNIGNPEASSRVVDDFNELVGRMREENYNDVDLEWLEDQNNERQILGLSGANLRRLLASTTLHQDKKDQILRIIATNANEGETRVPLIGPDGQQRVDANGAPRFRNNRLTARNLIRQIDGPELTRSVREDYENRGGVQYRPPREGERDEGEQGEDEGNDDENTSTTDPDVGNIRYV